MQRRGFMGHLLAAPTIIRAAITGGANRYEISIPEGEVAQAAIGTLRASLPFSVPLRIHSIEEVITASHWNTDIADDLAFLRGG